MEMEPIAPLFKRSKFRKPFNDVDAAADGNKFSELPESVVHHIFSFLETIDVIRASAVSTKWWYLWTSMPHLNFSYSYRSPRLSPSHGYDRYKDIINWVLMTHDKSVSIKSYCLSCWYDEDHSVYRWLHILAQKHVQELKLSLTSDCLITFSLPHRLLASDSLEELELELGRCFLKIPSYAGFSRLKSLKLVTTYFSDPNMFQNLFSNCPLLENLILKECKFEDFKVLDISSWNLRILVLEISGCWDPVLEGLCECDLKITCPNLVHFVLKGPIVKSFSWGKTPCFLQTAIFYPFWNDYLVPDDKFANYVLKILGGVCHVEFLKLRITILKYISPAVAKPGCFSTIFYNLKTLRLSTSMEDCDIRSIIYLLKCAPNLQLLTVYIDHDEYFEHDYKFEMLDEDIACLTGHLKKVELIDADNCEELELIRFLLKNAHVLEEMSVIWRSNVNLETRRAVI